MGLTVDYFGWVEMTDMLYYVCVPCMNVCMKERQSDFIAAILSRDADQEYS